MKSSRFLAAALFLLAPFSVRAEDFAPVQPEALRNWRDARFGMFIHWGPVSLTGHEIGWSRGAQTPIEEYDNLYKRFNPVNFNADEWVAVAKAAGMKYMVLTTKHHDGFCLWDSKATDYDIMATPFARDVVKELSEACKRGGIAFGTYYSTCDWHHPDFPLTSPGGQVARDKHDLDAYTDYLKAQTTELLQNYGPLFTLWYDVPQQFDAARGKGIIDMARAIQPSIVINSRTGAAGDYDTPEQRIGGFEMNRPWETCMTICEQWAWKPDDKMKSLDECVHTLIRTIGGDGNLLFNVGPQPDGLIEGRQVDRLKEMGAWVDRHAEGIFATRGGPYKPNLNIASTRKGNKIFLHVMRWNEDSLNLPPLPVKVLSAAVLGGGTAEVDQSTDALRIMVAAKDRHPVATVVALTLDGDAMAIDPITIVSGLVGKGAALTASSTYDDGKEYGAAMAGDGDHATRWATPEGTKDAWLEIAFPEAKSTTGIEIEETIEIERGMGNRVRAFKIQVAEADGGWKTVHEGQKLGADFKAAWPATHTGKLRLHVLDASNGPSISEIRVLTATP